MDHPDTTQATVLPLGFTSAQWRGTSASADGSTVALSFAIGKDEVVRLLISAKCAAHLADGLIDQTNPRMKKVQSLMSSGIPSSAGFTQDEGQSVEPPVKHSSATDNDG